MVNGIIDIVDKVQLYLSSAAGSALLISFISCSCISSEMLLVKRWMLLLDAAVGCWMLVGCSTKLARMLPCKV